MHDPLTRTRYWVYLVAMTGVAVSLLVTTSWGAFDGGAPGPKAVFYLGAGVLFAALALVHLRLRRVSERLERSAYLAGCTVLLFQIADSFSSLAHPTEASGYWVADAVLWVPVLHIVTYTLFHGRRALAYSLALFALLLGWSVYQIVWVLPEETNALVYSIYLDLQIAGLVSIALLSFFERAVIELGKAQALAEQHRALARSDALTGLANHRHIQEVLNEGVTQARLTGLPLSVVMIDLDHFKRVNDTHGHLVGDRVLREAAARTESVLRKADAAGRWGGEEFLLVLPATTHAEAARLAERLRERLGREPVAPVGTITASYGVAALLPDDDPSNLVERADAALYRAKREGRDRVAGG